MILADEQVASGQVLWPLIDHLGSVRDLVDSSGVVQNHLVYDSFGNIVGESNAAIDHIFGYTGRERDEESHLNYYRARYYGPETGRFISNEPIGFSAGDANLYRYVGNQSTTHTDPSGLLANKLQEQMDRRARWENWWFSRYFLKPMSEPDASDFLSPIGMAAKPAKPVLKPALDATGKILKDAAGAVCNKLASKGTKEVAEEAGALIVRQGTVSVIGKPFPKELKMAREIAEAGYDVTVRGKHAAGADFVINGVRTELKTLESSSINAIRQNIREAIKQAEHVIIDGRGCGMNTGDAVRAVIEHVRAGRMKNAKEIRFITKDGEYVWTPASILPFD